MIRHFGLYLLIVLVCAGLFSLAEAKSFEDAVWWSFVTSMTLGYGDIYPVTRAGRVVAVFEMVVVPLYVIPLIVAHLLSVAIKNFHEFTHDEQEEMKILLRQIKDKMK